MCYRQFVSRISENARANTEVASFLADNDFHNEREFSTDIFRMANGGC
jgi:hypothetical protein